MNNLVQLGTSGICGTPGRMTGCAPSPTSSEPGEPSRGRPGTRTPAASTSSTRSSSTEGGINVTAFGLDPVHQHAAHQHPLVGVDDGDAVRLTSSTGAAFSVCNSKSGTKFNDLRRRRRRGMPASPGSPGWTINLYKDTGTIGSYDGEPVFASDCDGRERRLLLRRASLAGNYIVCEVLQSDLGAVGTDVGAIRRDPGHQLPRDPRIGYAFAMAGSDMSGEQLRQLPARSDPHPEEQHRRAVRSRAAGAVLLAMTAIQRHGRRDRRPPDEDRATYGGRSVVTVRRRVARRLLASPRRRRRPATVFP